MIAVRVAPAAARRLPTQCPSRPLRGSRLVAHLEFA